MDSFDRKSLGVAKRLEWNPLLSKARMWSGVSRVHLARYVSYAVFPEFGEDNTNEVLILPQRVENRVESVHDSESFLGTTCVDSCELCSRVYLAVHSALRGFQETLVDSTRASPRRSHTP